jgi:mevalonate kinase
MKYFVPSKTFLTGEYSVLIGGAALGLATEPSFEMSFLQTPTDFQFHEKSPAGRYLIENRKSAKVHLSDPYISKGIKGGFGKSTAEYFAAILPDLIVQKKTIQQIRNEYLALFKDHKIKPSGIDLVFQYLGNVVLADLKAENFYSTSWKLKDLDFFVVSTGLKMPTHEHLENLNLVELSDLPVKSDQAIDAFLNKTSDEFIFAMTEWVAALRQLNLTHPRAIEFQDKLKKVNHVRLVKPCGALGIDVMLVFFNIENRESVESEFRKNKINIQAGRDQLTEGLQFYVG